MSDDLRSRVLGVLARHRSSVFAQIADADDVILLVTEECAKVAEGWTPEMPPSFNSLALTAAGDSFDARIRPIQEAAAKQVAWVIRKIGTEGIGT